MREPTGVLRIANWDEHERTVHMFYPRSGKKMVPPSMIIGEGLEVKYSIKYITCFSVYGVKYEYFIN